MKVDLQHTLYWPNPFALGLLQAVAQVIGNYPPADLVKAIDFAAIAALRAVLPKAMIWAV